MKNLRVGETVKLHHGGSLTKIKGFWSIDNMIKLKDTECRLIKFCIDYAANKRWDGFTCIYCSKANKAVKAQKVNFDFHHVKVSDNQYISKPTKAEIADSVKKKLSVKKFGLPDGANPVYANGLVDIFCKFYKDCRKYVRREHKNWRYFSCTKCPRASKFIRAQGSSSNIRCVVPKKGKRQS